MLIEIGYRRLVLKKFLLFLLIIPLVTSIHAKSKLGQFLENALEEAIDEAFDDKPKKKPSYQPPQQSRPAAPKFVWPAAEKTNRGQVVQRVGGYGLPQAPSGYGQRTNNSGFRIDSALNWGNNKFYFFKGDKYIRWTTSQSKPDKGYPKMVTSSTWPGLGR